MLDKPQLQLIDFLIQSNPKIDSLHIHRFLQIQSISQIFSKSKHYISSESLRFYNGSRIPIYSVVLLLLLANRLTLLIANSYFHPLKSSKLDHMNTHCPINNCGVRLQVFQLPLLILSQWKSQMYLLMVIVLFVEWQLLVQAKITKQFALSRVVIAFIELLAFVTQVMIVRQVVIRQFAFVKRVVFIEQFANIERVAIIGQVIE